MTVIGGVSKEKKLLNDPFYAISRAAEARRVFSEFVDRVTNGMLKNDGTDELLSLIDKCVLGTDDVKFIKSIKKNTKLYRARVLNPEDISLEKGIHVTKEGKLSGFNESESREAPLGFATEGRNNIKGVSYFYASNRPVTACCEVKPGVRQLVSLAEFSVVDTMHVVDFSTDKTFEVDDKISLGRLFTDIMFMYSRPVSNDEEYRATQILTDYIRKSGVDGICYKSFFDATGVNYTIFNSDHRRIKYLSSSILLFQSERKTFMDVNEKKVIQAESVGGASFDIQVQSSTVASVIKTLADNDSKGSKQR